METKDQGEIHQTIEDNSVLTGFGEAGIGGGRWGVFVVKNASRELEGMVTDVSGGCKSCSVQV